MIDFDKWFYEVCKELSVKYKKEEQFFYERINLTDAKLQYIDGVNPKDFIYD